MASRPVSTNKTFVEHHGLWTDEQTRAANAVAQAIKKHRLELVRFAFADQHGVLRGKTLLAADALAAMESGVTMTTTLLAKDTAHKTVYPVFTAGGGFGMAEMQGGGDLLMVADPATFRVLPSAPNTGWLLCDIFFADGKPVPFSTRQILRDALSRLKAAGFDYLAGLEVEFHLFKLENPRLAPEDATWPPRAPEVSLLNQGYQYLTESRFDQIEGALRHHGLGLRHPAGRVYFKKSSENQLACLQEHLVPADDQDMRTCVHMTSLGEELRSLTCACSGGRLLPKP